KPRPCFPVIQNNTLRINWIELDFAIDDEFIGMDLALGHDNCEGIVSRVHIFELDPPQRDRLVEIGECPDDGNTFWWEQSLRSVNEGYSIVAITRIKVDSSTVTIDDR